MDEQAHWEEVYEGRAADQVSWFARNLAASIEMIESVAGPDSSILDVGGGASTLVDDLLRKGYRHLAVLDISSAALQVAAGRLGGEASRVEWLVGDVRTATLSESAYDVWHDRALFHFLTRPEDRASYVRQAVRALRPWGSAIVATFAREGPDRCSGLDVVRYDAESLAAEFGTAFRLGEARHETHRTPWGSEQAFLYCRLSRLGSEAGVY